MGSKRRFSRIECNYKTYVVIGNVVIVEANILNISLNGMLFKLYQNCIFRKGDKWQLKFKLPNSDIILQIQIEVMHSHGNLVGVNFVHMNTVIMEHLSCLLGVKTGDSEQIADELMCLK